MIATTLTERPKHWRPPALAQRRPPPATDAAVRALERIARCVLAQAASVIDCTSASHHPVESRGYTDLPEVTDRAWLFVHDRHEIFCVVDEASERTLLAWLVGGIPARLLSSIERSIVAEAVRRLIATAGGATVSLREEPRIRPPCDAWRCEVQLLGKVGQAATLQFFAARESRSLPPAPAISPELGMVGLHLRATLPSVSCVLAEVRNWRGGSFVRLQRAERDIAVTLYASRQRIAVAQLGTMFGERALRIIAVGPRVP